MHYPETHCPVGEPRIPWERHADSLLLYHFEKHYGIKLEFL